VTSVLLHPAGGGLMPYLPLAAHLSERGPVSGIRAAGVLPGERPDRSVTAMADRYLPLVRALQPDLLVGWSMGGVLAWELAGRLTGPAASAAPAVVAIDSRAERLEAPGEGHRPEEGAPTAARWLLGDEARDCPEARACLEAHVRANALHTLSVRQAGAALLMVCGQEDVTVRLGAWERVADARLRVARLPGEHFDVFSPGVLPVLLGHLDRFLDEVFTGSRQPAATPVLGGAG
jgi:thioesterase domain-containing protein